MVIEKEGEEEGYGDQFTTAEPYGVQTDKASIVEKLLESNPVLTEISNFLLGYYKDDDGAIKVDDNLRLVNEKGCRAMLFEVGMRISVPTILGTITEEEAKSRAEDFEKAMAKKLVCNYADWEISNSTAMDIIVDSLGVLIFVALTRPIKGTTFDGIVDMSQIRQHTLQRDVMPTEEKKGMLKGLFGKKEKGENYGQYT